MTARNVERTWPKTTAQALAKYTVRQKAFANVNAALKDTQSEPGEAAYNALCAEKAKAERYLTTATKSLQKKGFTFAEYGGDPIPPAETPEEPKADKPKKATAPKRPTFASTLPAREKLAAKAGPNVAALLRSTDPRKLKDAEEAIALDLIASGAIDPTRKQIIAVGRPIFASHGLIQGVSGPAKQAGDAPRWAGAATVARIQRQVKDAAPKMTLAETAVADAEGDLDRKLTDEEATEVEREAEKAVA
jgi:hypothetical protein